MTFQQWSTPNTVYIKFTDIPSFQDKFYIGSTHSDVAAREHTRYRKLLQLQRAKLVSAELALRWWLQHDNFFAFAITPIYCPKPTEALLAIEQTFIQHLQPALNHPHISAWWCPRRGIKRAKYLHKAQGTGLFTLFCKLRRNNLPGRFAAIMPIFRSRIATWTFLTDLCSNTLRSFEAQRQLHHWNFPSMAFAPLCRLAANMPQPHSTICIKHLRNIGTKRGIPLRPTFRTFPTASILRDQPHPGHEVHLQGVSPRRAFPRCTILQGRSSAKLPCLGVPAQLPNNTERLGAACPARVRLPHVGNTNNA